MRALLTALLVAPLLLAACGDQQDPTGPATVPDMIASPAVAAIGSYPASITLNPGGTVCSQYSLTSTGRFRCR